MVLHFISFPSRNDNLKFNQEKEQNKIEIPDEEVKES